MIYYLLPTIVWFTFCTWRVLYTTTRLRFAHYTFALPLILLTILRGEVGTDTATYIRNAQNVLWWGDRAPSNEVGYEVLVRVLELITSDPRVVVGLVSLLAAVLFFVMLHMWDEGRGILSLVLIPFCYFDFTMNGLRMGLAFPLAVIAILQLERKRPVAFYILAIVSVSIQMTTAVLLILLLVARSGIRLSWRKAAYGLLAGAALLSPAYYIFADRIAYKVVAYSVMSSPTSLSGTGPLLMSFAATLLAIWISGKRRRYLGVTFLLVQLACFKISSFTYAGLRFQDMALFAQLLALSAGMIWPLRRRHLAAMVLLCCVVCGWTARNFVLSTGDPSAFLPYHFVWESQ